MNARILTQSDIKAKLNYDEITGLFTWVDNQKLITNRKPIAGSLNKNGYIYITLYYQRYRAHRLAWLYVTGKEPTKQIDHINGNKSDNRFINLREASNLNNTRNRKINANNTSGYRGVSFDKVNNKYVAYAMARGKRKKLGYYKTALSASKAFEAYAKQNHGEFYNCTVVK